MTDIYRGPNGEYGVYTPQTGMRVISKAEADQLQMSRMGRVLGAAGDALQDSAGFALDLMTPDQLKFSGGGLMGGGEPLQRRETLADRILTSNDPRQAARQSVDPTAALAGNVAAFGAEVAFPAGRIGKMAGKFRKSADEVVQQSRQAQVQAQARSADGTLSAARSDGPSPGSQFESPFLTPDDARNRNMPLTSSEQRLLAAHGTGDIDAIRKAEAGLANEDFMRKTSIAGDANAGDLFWRSKDKADWFTREVADKVGLHDVERLTPEAIRAFRDDASATFKRLLDNNPRDIPLNIPAQNGAQPIDILAEARGAADIFEALPNAVRKAIQDLESAAKRGSVDDQGNQVFHRGAVLEARKAMNDAATRAFAAGKHDTGSALTRISDTIDDAIASTMDENDQLALQRAREQWKIKKVLERTAGTMSGTEVGVINPVQFANNWRQMTPSYRNHTRARTDFEKTMDTVRTLEMDRAHTGNTLYRAIGPAAVGGAKAAAVGGAGAAIYGAFQ